MDREEWESLCDGCGRCCLLKLEDDETGDIEPTDIACRLLHLDSCRCSDYPNRKKLVPDCVQLTTKAVRRLTWLPPSCAYRLLNEGKPLKWWHPLISGDANTVHLAGVSVRNRVISETVVADEDFEDHVVSWPDDEL